MELKKSLVLIFNILFMVLKINAMTEMELLDAKEALKSITFSTTFKGKALMDPATQENVEKYKEVFMNTKDECLKECYAYSLNLLEISFNGNCTNAYTAYNEKYKKTKPCFSKAKDMQRIIDMGNGYLNLFCSVDEKDKPCDFVLKVTNYQNNATEIAKYCNSTTSNNSTSTVSNKCKTSLIQNYSAMIDAKNKPGFINETIYQTDTQIISISAPEYNLTKIENIMKSTQCLVKVNSDPTEQDPEILKDGEKEVENSVDFISKPLTLTTLVLLISLFTIF